MFFFFSESECFLEMGLDVVKRLCLQLGGGPVSGLSVQLAVLTSARSPAHPSGGLIQNKRIKKRREQKNAKTKQGKMTTFV